MGPENKRGSLLEYRYMKLSYLAGLVDGEGSIMMLGQGKRRSRRAVVSIGMTDQNVIEAIRETAGGFISVKQPKKENWQTMFHWRLNGIPAVELLEQLEPFLVIQRRKELARMLIDEYPRDQSIIGKVDRNQWLWERMQERNKERLPGLLELQPKAPTDDDCSYLAGILDGEGYIGEKLRIEVSSTDPELMSWCKSRFAGGAYFWCARPAPARPMYQWIRSPTGATFAAKVANEMLIERKKRRMLEISEFKRSKPPKYCPSAEQLEKFFEARDSGLLVKPASLQAGIPYYQALKLDKTR